MKLELSLTDKSNKTLKFEIDGYDMVNNEWFFIRHKDGSCQFIRTNELTTINVSLL